MDYCAPLALPHSRFLAWDELDQDKALAYMFNKAEQCPNCGTRDDDWYADENYIDDDGSHKTRKRLIDRPHLEVKSDTCEGCHEIEVAKHRMGDSEKSDRAGLRFHFEEADYSEHD